MWMLLRIAAGIAALALNACGQPTDYSELDRQTVFAPHALMVATPNMVERQKIVSHDTLRALYPNVDRRAYLLHLVHRITAPANTDEERAILWVRFLQDHFIAPRQPPIDTDGTAIYDPIWLLTRRIAACGQTNRLIVDGLNLIGIPSRLIQLDGHVAAEAFFDSAWHFLDADVLGLGSFVRKDGAIASTLDIVRDPSLLDNVKPLLEGSEEAESRHLVTFKSTFRPARDPNTGLMMPFAWIKTATPEQDKKVYFGWNYYRVEPLE